MSTSPPISPPREAKRGVLDADHRAGRAVLRHFGSAAVLAHGRSVRGGADTFAACPPPTRRPDVHDVPLGAGAPVEQGSLAACVASVLELPTAPGEHEALGGWLASLGLGLVPLDDAPAFEWAGPWVARVRAADGRRGYVVRYGAPSGTAWDPAGLGADSVLEAGWVLAALDPVLGRRTPSTTDIAGVVVGIAVAPRKAGPVSLVEEAEAIAGLGLAGDRYALGAGTFPSPGDGAAMTLFAEEVLASFTPPLTPDEHRRNVVTRGVDLDTLVGRRFTIGTVLCEGRRPAQPCAHLQRLVDRPLLRELVHRGGLRADVLIGGTLRVGDQVASAS